MRILLVGEFSRFHNSLKEGLVALGHEVVLAGDRDGFKNYPVDIQIGTGYQSVFLKKIRVGVYKATGIDIDGLLVGRRIGKNKAQLSGFDVVQFVHMMPFKCVPKYQKSIFEMMYQNNKRLFAVSAGLDAFSAPYYWGDGYRYNVFTPFKNERTSKEDFLFRKMYQQRCYQDLQQFVMKRLQGVFSTDLDYLYPLLNEPKHLGMMPYPINTAINVYQPMEISDKIVIFHGINRKSQKMKGNHFFEKALKLVAKKYAERIEIITTKSLPYDAYIQAYARAHIILDQVYAYDQGYNALEAMAKGKVVFTGAEKEFMEYYQLTERVAVNALPDADAIAKELSFLIEHPDALTAISKRARAFVEKEHDYIKIAQKYVDAWCSGCADSKE
ncbi:MAG: glycosyltransferase [Bacteroidetes bacterium]|nr:glycosyltransferase [Bacteroidota bacterium]